MSIFPSSFHLPSFASPIQPKRPFISLCAASTFILTFNNIPSNAPRNNGFIRLWKVDSVAALKCYLYRLLNSFYTWKPWLANWHEVSCVQLHPVAFCNHTTSCATGKFMICIKCPFNSWKTARSGLAFACSLCSSTFSWCTRMHGMAMAGTLHQALTVNVEGCKSLSSLHAWFKKYFITSLRLPACRGLRLCL